MTAIFHEGFLMKTSDLRVHILRKLSERELYGYQLHKKLAAEGKDIEVGRLYKVLNKMLEDRLVECLWKKSDLGPRRKMYSVSGNGKKVLEQLLRNSIDTIHISYVEYLMNLPHKASIFENMSNLWTKDLKKRGAMAFVAATSSPMNEKILSSLHNRLPKWSIFVVNPKIVDLELHLKDLVSLEGGYEDVPLRDDSVDLLIMMGLPKKSTLQKAVSEWFRVIGNHGRLTIIVPSVLVHRIKHPLRIGDFMENMEHHVFGKEEFIDCRVIFGLLQNYFEKVEEKQFVNLTMILVSIPRTISPK
jgi:DNA-binding PadR family transcriptional regulator